MTSDKTLPFWKAAVRVLSLAGAPLHYEDITQRALEAGFVSTEGKTPSASMNAQISVKIKRLGERSPFIRTGPGIFGLSEWVSDGKIKESEVDDRSTKMIRIPHLPVFSKMRKLLPVLENMAGKDVTWVNSELFSLRGTPQNPTDWQDPDTWISERLDGRLQDLTRQIWEGTDRQINPRHLRGSWFLAKNYNLVEADTDGVLHITAEGRDFLDDPVGDTVRSIDSLEGLDVTLKTVAEIGPAKLNDILPAFKAYALEVSNLRSDTSIKSFLWSRLRNLLDRRLIDRDGKSYVATDEGLRWLATIENISASDTSKDGATHIMQLVQRQAHDVRAQLKDDLDSMDPFDFEHLVKAVLEAMDYENVEVTAKSGDGGVDVIGTIQLGITEVKEVVQVKRHSKNVQRATLDALRGSLHRFEAVRGTIITNGDFAKGTREAAFEPGAAPITLINGNKLIDLMIEHRVGVKKRTFEMLELDLDSLTLADNGEDDT